MNLTEIPEIVQWPETHYVFIERIGPFMQTAPQAWKHLHALKYLIAEDNRITGAMALYKMKPDTYRAGFIVDAPASRLPDGVNYEKLPGGKYSRFTLTGSYRDLPQASGRVWQIVSQSNLRMRADWAIENYASDPQSTPEDQLITQILVPTA